MFSDAAARKRRIRGYARRSGVGRKLSFDRLEERRLLAASIDCIVPASLVDLVGELPANNVAIENAATGLSDDFSPISPAHSALSSPEIGQAEGEFSNPIPGITWIEFHGNTVVPELAAGFVIGELTLSRDAPVSQYEWSVSDERFEIQNSRLQLRASEEIDSHNEFSIAFAVTARHKETLNLLHYPMMLQVLASEHPSLGLEVERQFTVDENEFGAILGNVFVTGEYAADPVNLTVSDSRLEITDGVLKLKDSTRLLRADTEFLDVIITAQSLDHGAKVSKAARIMVDGDPTPFHNDIEPGDVDGDGRVTPLDPLMIINYLNSHGPGSYVPDGESDGFNLDVNGDGAITPLDALIVINVLNQQSSSRAGGLVPMDSLGQNDQGPGIPAEEIPLPILPGSDLPGIDGGPSGPEAVGEGGSYQVETPHGIPPSDPFSEEGRGLSGEGEAYAAGPHTLAADSAIPALYWLTDSELDKESFALIKEIAKAARTDEVLQGNASNDVWRLWLPDLSQIEAS